MQNNIRNTNLRFNLDKEQTVKNILEHLSDYAVNHFAHEEAYMEAQNDPELPLQKKEHQAFADHVKLLEKQPLTGENASAMLDEILTLPLLS